MIQTDFTNHFLIAMPSMVDPYFSSSIVYICQHDDHGAFGLIVNKPIDTDVGGLFAKLGISMKYHTLGNQGVLFGGPVDSDRGFVVHHYSRDWRSTLRVTEHLAVTTSVDILEDLGAGEWGRDSDVLISLGCCGWSPGQLEGEIKMNDWLMVPADPTLMFQVPVEKRYERALLLLGVSADQICMISGNV
ncbi:MAG: YqgE/AlgH family protein [Proteobacteria bacterium]|nr:YqgE/AlgH family protein [Pseudomonadota bacterium]MDA1332062.1 YqgE/AlgH family protein [Pseudomonadota bacterium]